jgi:hypothetical protein
MNRGGDYALAGQWLQEMEEKYGERAAIESGKMIGVIRDALARCDQNTREATIEILQRILENAKETALKT